MSESDLSSLSSAESIESDDELKSTAPRRGTLDQYFKNAKANNPPLKRKRPASPPHEYILADNPDIAFIVMFRARFNDVFPRSLPNYGPQDIERGVMATQPDEGIEKLLCALIGLSLNRKKDVERGHHTRALEEAISTYSNQWPSSWGWKSPLSGGASFDTFTPEQRLTLLKALVLWSLQSSEAVRKTIAEAYKGQRHEGDIYQERAVQPWGSDGDNRRYWLIEGLEDTYFRVYRENNPALKTRTWWSVADSIDSVQVLADKLREEGSQKGARLASSISLAVPRFEAGEDKRKRREYRLARKAQFARAEPGMSLYEGRTRGKRIKYTFSDDEDAGSDAMSGQRSRNSGISTPAELNGPLVTASGRHIKPGAGGLYGESLLSGQREEPQQAPTNGIDHGDGVNTQELQSHTRSRGAAGTSRAGRPYHSSFKSLDGTDEESDAPSSEWDSNNEDDDIDEKLGSDDDEDDDMSDEAFDRDDQEVVHRSLVISLKIGRPKVTTFKAETPDHLGVSEQPTMNGASPASSTIVLSYGDSKLDGERAALNMEYPQVLPRPPIVLKTEHIVVPPERPIQAPTPPLSDPQQNGKLDEVSLIEQPDDTYPPV